MLHDAAMERAVDIALIGALCTVLVIMLFTLPRLVRWIQREHLEQTEEIVNKTVEAVLASMAAQMLAEHHAAHREMVDTTRRTIAAKFDELSGEVNAALDEHSAALQLEMDATKGSIFKAMICMRAEVRTLKKGLCKMRRGLHAPDSTHEASSPRHVVENFLPQISE